MKGIKNTEHWVDMFDMTINFMYHNKEGRNTVTRRFIDSNKFSEQVAIYKIDPIKYLKDLLNGNNNS